MNIRNFTHIFTIIALGCSFSLQAQTDHQLLDYEVSFTIKNAGINVDGTFSDLDADIDFDPENPAQSTFEGRVPIKTIDTGIGMRDRHLLKENYFHQKRFPEMEMRSKSVTPLGEGELSVLFSIRIKGTEKEVRAPIKYVQNGKKINFSTNFTLNRRDFGVGGGSLLLSDELKVKVEATFEHDAPPKSERL